MFGMSLDNLGITGYKHPFEIAGAAIIALLLLQLFMVCYTFVRYYFVGADEPQNVKRD